MPLFTLLGLHVQFPTHTAWIYLNPLLSASGLPLTLMREYSSLSSTDFPLHSSLVTTFLAPLPIDYEEATAAENNSKMSTTLAQS